MNRLKVKVGVRFRVNMALRDRARYGARVSTSVQSGGCTRSGRRNRGSYSERWVRAFEYGSSVDI